MNPIGIVGLGLMGSALAERLLAGGFPVIGHDLREECRERLKQRGGTVVTSVSEVFAVPTILLSLPTSAIVAEVVAIGQPKAGSLIVDTTTGDPDETAALGERLSGIGVQYLDATLTGSSQVARSGELIVTAGGPLAAFQAAEPLFHCFAKRWFHLGPWGSGARTKLVVNLVLGLNRAVLAEGLSFAKSSGLDPTTILEVLRSGAAYSRAMDTKGPKMIADDFTPVAKLEQHLKDVRLIRAAGAKAGATLPLTAIHHELLVELVARGFGKLDNSAVIRAFDGGEP